MTEKLPPPDSPRGHVFIGMAGDWLGTEPCQRCGQPRAAHEPQRAEPQCACLEYWDSHPPDCPRVLAGLETTPAQPHPAPDPEDKLAERVARLAFKNEPTLVQAPDPEDRLRRKSLEMAEALIGCVYAGPQTGAFRCHVGDSPRMVHAACEQRWAKAADAIHAALVRVVAEEREACAMLHESVDVACDHERQAGHPGAAAMRTAILYRDAVRAQGLK